MKNFTLLFIIIFNLNFAFGQYHVNHIEYKKEIDSDVWETSDGYLWFFTEGQLCRFDGNEFEYFNYKDDLKAFKGLNVSNINEVNNGILFEYRGYIYIFKNGEFNRLNKKELYNVTGIYYNTYFDRNRQLLYRNVLYHLNKKNALIIIDSLDSKYNLTQRQINLTLNNSKIYSTYAGNYYYEINNKGQLDSIELNLPTNDFYKTFSTFIVNDSIKLFYSTFQDSAFLVSKDSIINTFNTSTNSADQEGFGFFEGDGLLFWTNGDKFSLYSDGYFIQNDTIQSWNIDNLYRPIRCLSEDEVLFRNGNRVFIKNFRKGSIVYIYGINSEVNNYTYTFSDGKIALFSNNEMYIMTPSLKKKYNNERLLTHFYDSYIRFNGNTIDSLGNIFGKVTNISARNQSYLTLSDFNSFNCNPYRKITINKTGPLYLKLLYKSNGDLIKLYTYVDTTTNSYKSKEIVSDNGVYKTDITTSHFFLIHDSLFKFNYARNNEYWDYVDIEKNVLQKDTLIKMKVPPLIVNNSFIFGIKKRYYSSKTNDSIRCYWQYLSGNMVLDSMDILTNESPQYYVLNKQEICLVNSGYTNTIYKLNIKSKKLNRYETPSYIYEKASNNMYKKHGSVDYKGNLWLPSEHGIIAFDNENNFKNMEISLNNQNSSQVSRVSVVHDTILLVLTKEELFYLDLKKYYSNKNFVVKSLIKLDNLNYKLIDEMKSGEIYISNAGYKDILILPPNFINIQFVTPPKLVLKSFQHDSIFEFGQYPEFKLVEPSDLKNRFISKNNNYVFKFSAQEYRDNKFLSYRYKVIGLFDDWEYSTIPEVKLKSLSYGKYTLEFQSIYQNEFSEPFTYTFTILPPWYHTWWARILYILTGLLVLFIYIRSRTEKLKKRQAELEKEVELATAEIKEQKNEVEQQRDKANQLKELAETQKEIVEEKNKEILDSITYAKRIQNAILPPPRLVKEWLNDSFIFYKPKDIVAGDFYWMEVVKKEGKNLIFYAAADCTGHGVPGAMVSVVCSNALNRAIKEFNITDPAKLLDKVTELVKNSFEQSEEAIKDGMDIAICALDLVNKKVWFAGAHNPLYRITNSDNKVSENLRVLEIGNRKLVEYKADKQPIGDFDHLKPFTTNEIQLEPGDCIYIFSDGFADQFGGVKNKKYKSANFKKLLMQIESNDMTKQKDILDEEIERWRGEIEQLDDICVIGVRINGEMHKIFTKRELEIIKYIAQGKLSKEIADTLNIAKSTVDTHRKRILTKSNTHNATELINFCKMHEII